MTINKVINAGKLFIPGKTTPRAHPQYGKDMRTIETWAASLEYTLSGGGGVIKSITGPGITTNPGALTQHGEWTVTLAGGKQIISKVTTKVTPAFVQIELLPRGMIYGNTALTVIATFITVQATKNLRLGGGSTTGGVFIGASHGRVEITAARSVDLRAANTVTIKGVNGTFIFVSTTATEGFQFRHTTTHTPHSSSLSVRTHMTIQTATTTTGNSIRFLTTHMGFFTKTPIAKPTVTTGTLASVITALRNLGLCG
jgi:hypothetical protein